jgi:hypothetical protein
MQQVKIKHLPAYIMRHRCDLCSFEGLTVYVPEIDRWLCGFCVRTLVRLLEIFD